MGNLFLQTRQKTDFTMLPNNFIDNEMSEANGDFVKVYIYLLRCSARYTGKFLYISHSRSFQSYRK